MSLILSYLKQFLSKLSIKDYLIAISIIIFIGLIAGLIYFYEQNEKNRILYDSQVSINTQKEQLLTNKLGEKASEVDVLTIRYSELKKSYENAQTEYQKELSKVYDEIEFYKRLNKDLQSFHSVTIISKDTIFQKVPGDCKLKPISTPNINIGFIYNSDSIGTYYDYHANIFTLISFYPKLKANGKKHFPNWGFLPWVGWDEKSITTIDDKNAAVTNQVSIKFSK